MAGPNSVGKTALWDVACLYASRGRYARLRHLPESREEYTAFIHEVNVRRSNRSGRVCATRNVSSRTPLSLPGLGPRRLPRLAGATGHQGRPSGQSRHRTPSPGTRRRMRRDRQRLAGELRLRERTAHRRRLLRRRGLGPDRAAAPLRPRTTARGQWVGAAAQAACSGARPCWALRRLGSASRATSRLRPCARGAGDAGPIRYDPDSGGVLCAAKSRRNARAACMAWAL